jgi:hypothetical protein
MYHVNADDLPGNEVFRTFVGGRHGPCSVSFFLVRKPAWSRSWPPRDLGQDGLLTLADA